MKISKIIISFLLLTMCSLLFAGCYLFYVDITGLDIKTASQISLFTNETVDDMTVKVAADGKWSISDVNVVIADESIIKINYAKDSSDKYAINFKIKGLREGITSFFFETTDRSVRSNVIIVSVGPAYTSIEFKDPDLKEIAIRGLADSADVSFQVCRGEKVIECPVDVQIISENPEVVEIVYIGNSGGYDVCSIVPRSYGGTYIYLQSPDGEIKTERIRVIVIYGEEEDPNYFVLNTGTKKIHNYGCHYTNKLDPEKRLDIWGSLDSYYEEGYTECGHCFKKAEKPEESDNTVNPQEK